MGKNKTLVVIGIWLLIIGAFLLIKPLYEYGTYNFNNPSYEESAKLSADSLGFEGEEKELFVEAVKREIKIGISSNLITGGIFFLIGIVLIIISKKIEFID